MWQRNSSPASLEWISLCVPLSSTKTELSHHLKATMEEASQKAFHLLSLLPSSHPLIESYHNLEKKLQQMEIPIPSPSSLLLLTDHLPHAGRLAASADASQLSGATVTWESDSFFLTSFGHHHFRTDHLHYNDLALPSSLSPNEKEILALGLLLYSGGKFSSLLTAVDQARRMLRKQD